MLHCSKENRRRQPEPHPDLAMYCSSVVLPEAMLPSTAIWCRGWGQQGEAWGGGRRATVDAGQQVGSFTVNGRREAAGAAASTTEAVAALAEAGVAGLDMAAEGGQVRGGG